ncbi:MAG: hypothetical protein R2861_14115 [Desulfobacterales bacterium]
MVAEKNTGQHHHGHDRHLTRPLPISVLAVRQETKITVPPKRDIGSQENGEKPGMLP